MSRLLSTKKLTLIVDLDQTIIHATVDKTVSEWKKDKNNVNHKATQGVVEFSLPDSNMEYYVKLR